MNDLDDPPTLARWLRQQTSLAVLRERFQPEWTIVEQELAEAVQARDKMRLDRLLRPRLPSLQLRPTGKRRFGKQETRQICTSLIRQRMAALAVEDVVKSSLSEGKPATIGPIDRLLFRLLFFTADNKRRIVRNRLFRLLWPLVRRPNLLLPEAEAHGIYCFFSRDFITALAELVKAGRCIEVAAGDGALARALRRQGSDVIASDDYSWDHKISYPEDVQKLDVKDALKAHTPVIVLCSWPPARNDFEQHIFKSKDVQRYIVIGSEHEFAFGNWSIYQADQRFSMRKDPRLSSLLLPREFGAVVYIFDRK